MKRRHDIDADAIQALAERVSESHARQASITREELPSPGERELEESRAVRALCAPLVVGLLEQIRHATYRRAAANPGSTPVFFCLDEIANIAPIPDLPALASEAGGQAST